VAEVIHNTEKNRFEIRIDGSVVGCSMYQLFEDTIVFTHTVIEADRQEHGLAGQLVQSALDRIRDTTHLRVVAQCPYVAHWISTHPDYQDLLTR
jgi:predicted GNAT family acetyltransferase